MRNETLYLAVDIKFDVALASPATLDTEKLTAAARAAYLLSMDARISIGHRATLNALGDKLSDRLTFLLKAKFEEGTTELVAANNRIAETNRYLREEAAKLDKIADTVEQLGKLVAAVDKLVGILL